jgi:DNA end-binding protein Ku
MRAIWTGAIGFGLVNIPVKLFRYVRVNENTGQEVAWQNIVKGYKYDGEYIVITDKDFEAASPKKTKLIEISDFVKEEEIDTVYYETPYYLEPDKTGSRAYALLREALRKTGMIGVASFVMRSKESLAVLKPSDDVIVLNRIRFYEEIRSTDELVLPEKTVVKPKELDMAIALINQLTGKFDITKYRDTYAEVLMEVIESKAKGAPVKAHKMKVVHRKTEDLMEQLKASLGTKRKKAS